MKTINFLKNTLVATLSVALTLGFSACSDDDNGSDPINPEVKLLPTKITTIAIDNESKEESTSDFTFEYNSKNQLVTVTEDENRELFPTVHTIEYAADGRISKYTYIYPASTNIRTYTYDDTKGTVTVLYSNGSEQDKYNINKDGVLLSYKSEVDKTILNVTFEYDKYTNLTKFYTYYQYNVELIEETTIDATYSTKYNPYLNIAFPVWFMFEEGPAIPMAQGLVGAHLPTKFESVETLGKDKENIYIESSSITVSKEQSNYPTEIKVANKETNNGVETSTSTTTIAIEYKEAQ